MKENRAGDTASYWQQNSPGSKAKEEARKAVKADDSSQHQLQLTLSVHNMLPSSVMLRLAEAEIHWVL